jgi:CRP-like cAMP-binding protein
MAKQKPHDIIGSVTSHDWPEPGPPGASEPAGGDHPPPALPPHVERLRSVEIFAKLNDDELAAVAKCVHERKAGEDQVLIKEGVPGESLYIIDHGSVVVEKTIGKKAVKLATLSDGAVFGEMSLIDNFPTSASVRTTAPSTFLLISRLDLNVLLTWDTVLASKMWRSFTEMLCYRVRASNERLMEKFGESAGRELMGAAEGIEPR